jgi:predicted dehydrogenase/threonine dehydrogenase-like Zn-dependent dehydrogenase
MKQIIQNLKTGEITLFENPCPTVKPGHVLIRTGVTLLSSGTERTLVEFGRGNYIQKAQQQPEKVRMVLDKIRTDGLMPTFEAIQSKLDQPFPLGYCNVGQVLEAGSGVSAYSPGQRVVSNGPHAEIVQVPVNLCASIPENVPDETAVFTVLGAIALQGIRLAQPSLGETFAVMGLGLVGLLTVQILRAHGCRVIGFDPDPHRCELAARLGIEAIPPGGTIDGALITAATRSNEPMHAAAKMCRKRGRIVLVGVTGLQLSRDDFYKKELTFQVSCSYGPGRYDPAYEEDGQDYPLPFVRWTAKRNFEAVLQLMSDNRLEVTPLITHRFPIADAVRAYDAVLGKEPTLGVLLSFPTILPPAVLDRSCRFESANVRSASARQPHVALIGAGQHALKMLLPAIRKFCPNLVTVADYNGVAAAYAAKKFGFASATTDVGNVLADSTVDTVFITTRHDSHADLVCKALRAGKNVFVEKPLAIRPEELQEIQDAHKTAQGILMVGFNRRFSVHVVRMRELLKRASGPKAMIITINAGVVAADHWTQDPTQGGGRIIGEACHFVDTLRFLIGSPIISAKATYANSDTVAITFGFEGGSVGTIHYLGNGHKSFPKERFEAFCDGGILQLDNFRKLQGYGWPGFSKMRLLKQDKGHAAAVSAFASAIGSGGPSPIVFEELIEVTKATFDAAF